MSKLGGRLLAAVVIIAVLLGLGAMVQGMNDVRIRIREEETKIATDLAEWYVAATWALYQERQGCEKVGDACCWDRIPVEQKVLDLQLDLACYQQGLSNALCVDAREAAEAAHRANQPAG